MHMSANRSSRVVGMSWVTGKVQNQADALPFTGKPAGHLACSHTHSFSKLLRFESWRLRGDAGAPGVERWMSELARMALPLEQTHYCNAAALCPHCR